MAMAALPGNVCMDAIPVPPTAGELATLKASAQWVGLQTYMTDTKQTRIHSRLILTMHTTSPPGGPMHTMGPMHSLARDGNIDLYTMIAPNCFEVSLNITNSFDRGDNLAFNAVSYTHLTLPTIYSV